MANGLGNTGQAMVAVREFNLFQVGCGRQSMAVVFLWPESISVIVKYKALLKNSICRINTNKTQHFHQAGNNRAKSGTHINIGKNPGCA